MKAVSMKNSLPSQFDQKRKESPDDGRTHSGGQEGSYRQSCSRVFSDRIVESEFGDWCGRFAESDLQHRLHQALARASHPLKNVQCTSDGQTLTLSGVVECYHHAQIAIELVRSLADGRRIDCQIKIAKPVCPVFTVQPFEQK